MSMTFPSVRHRALPSDQDATGRTLGDEEIAAVTAALRSGVLTSTKGSFVKDLESRFAAMMGVKHAFACSSGTAAIHCAVAAIDPEPGDEIITTSITDMGALTPLLYQGAIPVFADVDPATCNVTAATVAEKLSDRTKAIIVTHLFGNPCEIDEIVALGNRVGVPVIEDCAQAFLAAYNGNFVGTIGRIGCFSLQQGKHVTSGEGGLVVTNDDELARRMYLSINKAWGYGDPRPDHYFIALNYRMSEVTGAVAGAQLKKLPTVVLAAADACRTPDGQAARRHRHRELLAFYPARSTATGSIRCVLPTRSIPKRSLRSAGTSASAVSLARRGTSKSRRSVARSSNSAERSARVDIRLDLRAHRS